MSELCIDPYWLMEFAIEAAEYSVDPSVQNGAAVSDPVGNATAGYNSFVEGVEELPERWERPDKYLWVEHAERNAIYSAAKDGFPLDGGAIACPWAACADCARAIVQSGLQTLYRFPMPDNERWSRSVVVGDTIMSEGGVQIVELDMADFSIPSGLRLGQMV